VILLVYIHLDMLLGLLSYMNRFIRAIIPPWSA
jgi:hypothetical protein